MQRSVTTMTLLFASVSAILGSGWLFAAYYASSYAGPAAMLSWLIACVCIIFVAFVFAELNTMLPVMGASTRIPQMTHGTLVGFMYSWIIWLCYASIPPTEVQAMIQYLSFYYPHLTHLHGELTEKGYFCATTLMLLISGLNAFSLRWLLRANSTLTMMKLLIPAIIIVYVLAYHFEPHRLFYPGNSTAFTPTGIKGIFSAISAGGMVYAFNGFTQASEWAGAVKNPGRSMPIALIGAIFLTLFIYLGLQAAFLVSLTPENLVHGWQHISLHGSSSPLAAILHQGGLSWLVPLLFVGALIGPFAAALIYTSGATHSLQNKSINGYLPGFLQILTPQRTPIYAILTNFCFGMLLFAPLPGWNKMMGFLTSLMAMTYTIGPICLLALRDQAPNQKRPLRLPFGKIWAGIAFYLCTVFTYFNGWNIISKLSIGFLTGLLILIIYRLLSNAENKPQLHWAASVWIWPYIIGLTLISYLGSFGDGKNILPFGWDLLVLAVFTTSIFMLAGRFKLPAEQTQKYIAKLALKH